MLVLPGSGRVNETTRLARACLDQICIDQEITLASDQRCMVVCVCVGGGWEVGG